MDRRVFNLLDADIHKLIAWDGPSVDMAMHVDAVAVVSAKKAGFVQRAVRADDGGPRFCVVEPATHFLEGLTVEIDMHPIVVTKHEIDPSIQTRSDLGEMLLPEADITEMVNDIMRLHDRIPALNHHLIHMLHALKSRAQQASFGVGKLQDIGVPKVMVGYEPAIVHTNSLF